LELSINGKARSVNFASLGEWASAEFGNPVAKIRGVALAVNDKVIPKSKWEQCILKDGDRILAIEATQGG
jgi:sulfur carrier protein